MDSKLWYYRCRVIRVVDGDTIIVELDTGFHSTRWESLRLLGVDTPEVVGADRKAGEDARGFVRGWVAMETGHWPFLVRTHKTDNFGRYLGDFWRVSDGRRLADALIEAGHGRAVA